MTEFAEGPDPQPTLADAGALLAKYDSLSISERLSGGDVMLLEVQARALYSIAESLEQLAGESFRREAQL